MNKDIIGIKLADGSFYPVLTAGKAAEKQLKLTTARDGQTSIRLHLYRSAFGAMEDAEYIDSLRIDGLASHQMNEPTVACTISMDAEGNISAELSDSETGTISSKTVPLSLPDITDIDFDYDIPEPQDSSAFDIPPLTEEDLDFDIDTPAPAAESAPSFDYEDSHVSRTASIMTDVGTAAPVSSENDEDFSMTNSPFTDSSLYDSLGSGQKKSGISVPVAISIICAIICLCVLGIMIFISPPKWLSRIQEEVPGYTYEGELIPENTEDDKPSPNEDIIVMAKEPIVPEQPVLIEPDAAEDSKQIKHLVKWGDTLWDLAGCYYKNPWAYPRIAKENNIKNPDFIVSGTILIIPR